MIYALVDGAPQRPTATGQRARCGCCGGAEMISVCGSQVEWHWRHAVGADCDSWAAGKESPWHHDWKMRIGEGDPARIERVIVRDGVTHRADAVIPHPDGDIVVEVQHSWLSQADLTAREVFYGRMVWLMDSSGLGTTKTVERGHLGSKRTFTKPILVDHEDPKLGRVLVILQPSPPVRDGGYLCRQGHRMIADAISAVVEITTPARCARCDEITAALARARERQARYEAEEAARLALRTAAAEDAKQWVAEFRAWIARSHAARLERAARAAEDAARAQAAEVAKQEADAEAERRYAHRLALDERARWQAVKLRPGDQAAVEADLARLAAQGRVRAD